MQIVRAIQLEDNKVMLQCIFVTGSDASGCLVMLYLVGDAENITVKLAKEGKHICAMKVVNLTNSSTNINEILGFDIESNGSIGTLPIPGELNMWNVSQTNCASSDQIEPEENTASKLCIML